MKAALRGNLPVLALVLSFTLQSGASSSPSDSDQQTVTQALQWVRSTPRMVLQYNYVMTARVRLLFFWAGKDDVGGGYIRRGIASEDSRKEFFQVLFGSDPAKAPRAINRWGAGTEVSWHKEAVSLSAPQEDVTASAFFGFMKSSRGKSAAEMQAELKREQEHGEHSFTGILSRVDPSRAVSLVTNLQSDTDYSLHDYDQAVPTMLDRLSNSTRPLRTLQEGSRCPRAEEFLATVAELVETALVKEGGGSIALLRL